MTFRSRPGGRVGRVCAPGAASHGDFRVNLAYLRKCAGGGEQRPITHLTAAAADGPSAVLSPGSCSSMKTAVVLECDFASGQNKNRENEFGCGIKRAQIQAAFEQAGIPKKMTLTSIQ